MLAAGHGTRLRPLTELRPKPLCPVNNRPLLDWALDAVAPHCGEVAVNVNAHPEQMLAHLAALDVHVSVEAGDALGTAGGIGNLRDWVAGRDVLVGNADAWRTGDLGDFVAGWDHERVRLLCVSAPGRGDFGDLLYAGACLLPWRAVAGLAPEPTGLYEVLWQHDEAAGRLDLVVTDETFIDCGTVRDYILANLTANGGQSVVAPDAVVEGEVLRSVVWPASAVRAGERLVDGVRAGDLTVPAG